MSTDEKMELQVLQSDFKFAWNFDEVKNSLADYTEKYVGLVVTDENLKDMERTGKDIASLRTKVEKFRKSVKSEMDKPYKAFEVQVNDLKKIIAGVEEPIKDQLDKYEADRVAKEKAELLKYAAETAAGIGLRKENSHITILAKWTNRTAKKTEVRQEICAELDRLLQQQTNEDNALALKKQKDEIVAQLCQTNSELYSLETPVTPQDIYWQVANAELNQISDIVKSECAKRAEQQRKVVDTVLQATVQQTQQDIQKVKQLGTIQKHVSRYNLILKFESMTIQEAQMLCNYIKANSIRFETISKERAD